MRLSLVAVPVKAYPAVSSAAASKFHLIHTGCGQRLQYQKCCPNHGPLTQADIGRAYALGRDQLLPLEPDELEQLRPAKDKALVLEQFVPLGQIDPALYAGRSLYLWPDGSAAQHPYAVLTRALAQAGKAGLATVVLSSLRQLVLVRPHAGILVLDVLHYPAQVRPAPQSQCRLPATSGADSSAAAELALADQLITLASQPLDWSRYRNRGAEELEALVQAKLKLQPPAPEQAEPVVLQLLEALQESVAQIQGVKQPAPVRRRPARSVTPRRRTG